MNSNNLNYTVIFELITKINLSLDVLNNKIDNSQCNQFRIVKPILKWLGGKTQIIDIILNKTPIEINNYHEMFVGGGSILLGNLTLLKHKKISISGKIFAYDINQGLINMYKQIQTNKDELYDFIQLYITQYDKCPVKTDINRNPLTLEDALKSKENYYYWMRNKFNNILKNTIEHAALFIVINKTTFRGMYREGPKGFNVPYGNYKTTPIMISKEDLNILSLLIKDVIFICCDFEESFKNIKDGDYLYLDPPYAPETSKSFVGYNENGFDINKHNILFDLVKKNGTQKNIKFCMSNANVKLVSDNFSDSIYKNIVITCKRSINSKKPQSKTEELIITNY